MTKAGLPQAFSREEFERLSHPEKLQYLTLLINALDRAQPPDRAAKVSGDIESLPVLPRQAAGPL